MQTFLPYPNIQCSIKCLDNQQLGKQRVEAKMIYDILCGNKEYRTFKNHPAVRMWKGFTGALSWYHDAAIVEWIMRGFKNTMPLLNEGHKISPFDWYQTKLRLPTTLPFWFGGAIHASHRSNLLRKSPFYLRYGWKEPPNLPYIWP